MRGQTAVRWLDCAMAGKLFDPVSGKITDPAYVGRLKKFVDELIWMARALRFGRENLSA